MKQNIDTINSMIRITCGLSMLTYITIRGARRESDSLHPLLIGLSAMKVAEGIVRYCPLKAVYDEWSTEKDGIEQSWQQEIQLEK
ncbi:Protein of unknown function [Halobacillus karajensis]|uniref:Inner membrane protein YgaP-like transmembrane domain-containing protein n=1 Tax=Halobacillus karajensis TaxID=195088 RepID=A0A024P4C0_9BACI|nr:DUF2892 domain-containing protein [Halobacillus karajensis]CDQ20616.1 hypothetical protein BN982_02966 [Halobacillus karajensis]CDQ23914.1 hypothetical protein BN983_02170 [Halobacillus karajensis]CDQ27392.1 hypothetical protein BN981_01651 [Halobacillus karajensis]SEH88690.1 Protein of unknown function [Halobacillus karajensis]